jgi:hypothetical protein
MLRAFIHVDVGVGGRNDIDHPAVLGSDMREAQALPAARAVQRKAGQVLRHGGECRPNNVIARRTDSVNEIFNALLKQKLTRDRLLEAVVVGFERSATPDDATANGTLVERGGPFPVALAQRLEAAARSNQHLAAVRGLREQIQRVARAIGKQSL